MLLAGVSLLMPLSFPLSLFSLLAQPLSAKSANEPEEWLLIAKHAELGLVRFYLTHDAIKAEIDKTHVCMVAKAPLWKLCFFRKDDKIMWIGDIDRMEPAGLVNPFNRSDGRKTYPIQLRKAGVPYVPSRTKQDVEVGNKGKCQGLNYTEYSTVNARQRCLFWTTPDIAVDSNCANAMCRFFGVPNLGQIPIYLRKNSFENPLYAKQHAENRDLPFLANHGALVEDLRTGPQIILETKSVKKIAYDAKSFPDPPTGYKRVPAIVDVTYSKAVKNDITSLMDDLAFTTKDGETKKSNHGKQR